MPDQKLSYASHSIAIVLVLHLAGALFLLFSNGKVYTTALLLTPINLLITAGILMAFHKDFSKAFIKFICFGFFTSLAIEMIGVNTGFIFGKYEYGPVLGLQIWNTPVIIGLNWLLITYCAGSLIHSMTFPVWVKVLAGTSLLVLLDYFMEPVAMKHNFWNWSNGSIPVQNYWGWAFCALIMMTLYFQLPFEKKNPVAIRVGMIQFGFFIIQNLF